MWGSPLCVLQAETSVCEVAPTPEGTRGLAAGGGGLAVSAGAPVPPVPCTPCAAVVPWVAAAYLRTYVLT